MPAVGPPLAPARRHRREPPSAVTGPVDTGRVVWWPMGGRWGLEAGRDFGEWFWCGLT